LTPSAQEIATFLWYIREQGLALIQMITGFLRTSDYELFITEDSLMRTLF
jgi:hypothetical protein